MALAVFGARLRRLRGRLGLTQQELASRSGLHKTYISRLERGEQEPRLTNLLRVAKGLGVEPGELLGEAARGLAALEGKRMRGLLEGMLRLSHELGVGDGRRRSELEGLILKALELLQQALALIREGRDEDVSEAG